MLLDCTACIDSVKPTFQFSRSLLHPGSMRSMRRQVRHLDAEKTKTRQSAHYRLLPKRLPPSHAASARIQRSRLLQPESVTISQCRYWPHPCLLQTHTIPFPAASARTVHFCIMPPLSRQSAHICLLLTLGPCSPVNSQSTETICPSPAAPVKAVSPSLSACNRFAPFSSNKRAHSM